MLLSTVQRREEEFLVLYSRFFLLIYFIHIIVYMSIPISQFIPAPCFPPLVSIHLSSTSVSLFLFSQLSPFTFVLPLNCQHVQTHFSPTLTPALPLSPGRVRAVSPHRGTVKQYFSTCEQVALALRSPRWEEVVIKTWAVQCLSKTSAQHSIENKVP